MPRKPLKPMHPQQYSPQKWSEIVIAAETAREPFEDVTIVSTKNMFVDLAYQAAADLVHKNGHALTDDKVKAVACAMINAQKISVQEHVQITNEGITICINAKDINEEHVVWQALDFLAEALDQLDGGIGIVTFSDNIRFSLSEVPWVISH